MTPPWLNIGLILCAFVALPLSVMGYFLLRAYASSLVRRQVLRELIGVLRLACKRDLPFPAILEGFASSLADRGADTALGRLVPGRAGRMAERSALAFAFANESRRGGLPYALRSVVGGQLIAQPYLGWLCEGYDGGSLQTSLDTVAAQLRHDQRQRTSYAPLLSYVAFTLFASAFFGELAFSMLQRASALNAHRLPLFWLPWLLTAGWSAYGVLVLSLAPGRAGWRAEVFHWVPLIGPTLRLRAEASRLRLLESAARAGRDLQRVLRELAERGDAAAARAAQRVAEGEGPIAALGYASRSPLRHPLPEQFGLLAAEHELAHGARLRALSLASLPLGLLVGSAWALTYHVTFFTTYGTFIESGLRPW